MLQLKMRLFMEIIHIVLQRVKMIAIQSMWVSKKELGRK